MLLLASVLYSCYSFSEEVFGVSPNAANPGLDWVMTNVLPQQAGLQVNEVTYQYTANKQTEDAMIVHVQNENARGAGYIFRETDDWSGIPGNTINKSVQTNGIDISYWGRGSIEVEGDGTVTDPTVLYTYKYDTCFDPQTSPECPGYKPIINPIEYQPEVIDPLDDDLIQNDIDRKKVSDKDDDEDERERKNTLLQKKNEIEKNLEDLLGVVEHSALSQQQMIAFAALSNLNSFSNAYFQNIDGGSYPETVVLNGGKLPKNPKAARLNFASDLRHQRLMDLQYEVKTKPKGEQ